MKMGPAGGLSDQPVAVWGSGSSGTSRTPVSGSTSASALLKQVNLKVDMVPKGTHGRKVIRPMKPRYITIHSTQNYTADADRHSLALKRGALRAAKRKGGNRIGYLIWHFTVDDRHAVQHMPTNEQGEHADFDGPGNNYSIGIEMCEQRGSNINATIDRTAKLAAYLMYTKGIPLSGVVPHYHWPRKGTSRPHKDCPHFLLDNGRPGRKWKAFQARVNGYYKQIQSSAVASR
ncbi:N-acetylmuramoyl-L-alanine amidase family protein [Haloferula chungangensis]|uniref:N-acetylmuramoyl-L-alanine amidase n=2 Tax=Haloferula chungangensis TaxID=1048331 RepID=A0ABW2L2P3_9BACT